MNSAKNLGILKKRYQRCVNVLSTVSLAGKNNKMTKAFSVKELEIVMRSNGIVHNLILRCKICAIFVIHYTERTLYVRGAASSPINEEIFEKVEETFNEERARAVMVII